MALLDWKVVIGSTSKGRSSSKQMNYYLSTNLPYMIGGDLYPFLQHVASKENPSDDVFRFIELRKGFEKPWWLQLLLQDNHKAFDQIVAHDKLRWPFNGWARLIRLSILVLGNQ